MSETALDDGQRHAGLEQAGRVGAGVWIPPVLRMRALFFSAW